jgi:pyridoxine 4-dehydrogenase
MTWPRTPISDKEAFAAIKGGIDALPPDVKMFLNSGPCVLLGIISTLPTQLCFTAEFYGPGLSPANLELLARFFDEYPEYADRTFLSVKGGFVPGQLVADGSGENLHRSVRAILKALRGTKRLDLFVPARLDTNYTIEHYARVLNEMVKEGQFGYIGLSTVGAETIRRAHKVRCIFHYITICA